MRCNGGDALTTQQNIIYLQLIANSLSQPVAKDLFLNKIMLKNRMELSK
jgi:hypothetical protein